jgi:isoquinoline 1-oxidoreductase beta subunit
VSVERLEAGLDGCGKPVAWLHRSVAPSLWSTFEPGIKNQVPIEFGMGFVNTPFALPNARFENPEAEAHTRIGWLRGVEQPAGLCDSIVRCGAEPMWLRDPE